MSTQFEINPSITDLQQMTNEFFLKIKQISVK